MREIRQSGSEGGETELNRSSLPLSLLGNFSAPAELHFIWSLAEKCRVRKPQVVFLDVEGNQLLQRADRVQRVQ